MVVAGGYCSAGTERVRVRVRSKENRWRWIGRLYKGTLLAWAAVKTVAGVVSVVWEWICTSGWLVLVEG